MRKLFLISLLFISLSAQAFKPSLEAYGPMAATGTIQVAFAPWNDPARLIEETIEGARQQILVQAFSFTHVKIAQALIAAKKRGVEVIVIADKKQTEHMNNSQIPLLAKAGVPVFLDDNYENAHNKVMVIDAASRNATVITGSFNFTHGAQYRNAENVLLIRGNLELAKIYADNWKHHLTTTQRYD